MRQSRSTIRVLSVGILLVSQLLFWSPPSYSASPELRDDAGTEPARAAITRLAAHLGDRFVLRLEPNVEDTFSISSADGRILLEGSDNGALVSAFARYLEEEAGGQIARGPDNIPNLAPEPKAKLDVASPYEYRYFNNFTVGGYTTPNWGWERWQEEIDLLAAHGANTALVTVGQEAVWMDTFQDFGYTAQQVRDWIVPTSHQPWQWMGNIEDTDSGLTSELIERRAALGRKIIDRMRALDITPVVPGYSGIVPPGFADRNVGAHVVPQGEWHDYRRPDWLDTTTELYADVAASYYRHQQDRFGVLHAQAIDLLHEGGASGGVPLDQAAQGIERALAAADRDYLWVIQAWQQNPRKEIVEAVDASHLLVLDLTHGQWQLTNAFHGAPWAWGELGNFGGRLGLFGHMDDNATDLPAALAAPESGQLRGIALMHEGLEQDPIVEQLWSRMSWETQPLSLDTWTHDYVKARYGVADPDALAAWQILVEHAFQVDDARRADSVLNAEPDLTATSAAQRWPNRLPYDPGVIEDALVHLLKASTRLGHLDTYQYDLVDVTRQVIANRGRVVLPSVKTAYLAGDRPAFRSAARDFLKLLRLQEDVLSTRSEFLFGQWVNDARSWGTTPAEGEELTGAAKRLLTIWAETRAGFSNLKEYANRDWAGLVGQYYLPRWQQYLDRLDSALRTGEAPAPTDWFEYGEEFVRDDAEAFATTPSSDPVRESLKAARELLSLKLDPLDQFRRGGTVVVDITVRNVDPTASLSGPVNIEVPDGWSASPSAVQFPSLPPGESVTVSTKVDVPADAEYGLQILSASIRQQSETLRGHHQVEVARPSLSLNRPAVQSSTAYGGTADRAVDGITDGNFNNGSVTHTATEAQPWWQVDLGSSQAIEEIVVWNRTDCCGERLQDFYVLVSEEPFTSDSLEETLQRADVWSWHRADPVGAATAVPVGGQGRYVRVQMAGDRTLLSLAEVQAFAPER